MLKKHQQQRANQHAHVYQQTTCSLVSRYGRVAHEDVNGAGSAQIRLVQSSEAVGWIGFLRGLRPRRRGLVSEWWRSHCTRQRNRVAPVGTSPDQENLGGASTSLSCRGSRADRDYVEWISAVCFQLLAPSLPDFRRVWLASSEELPEARRDTAACRYQLLPE
jgi:hypothetical protein